MVNIFRNAVDNLWCAGRSIYNLYDLAREVVLGFFILNVFACILAIFLAMFEIRFLNSLLGLIYLTTAIVVASRPEILSVLIGLGSASNPRHPIEGSETAIKEGGIFVCYTLLVISVFLLILSVLPIERNYQNIFLVLFSFAVLFLIGIAWGIQTVLAKSIIYWLALGTFVFSLGSFVPGYKYVYFIGFDPYSFIRCSEVKRELSEIQIIQKENQEEMIAGRLRRIKEKIKNNPRKPLEKILTPQDIKFLREQTQKQNDDVVIKKMFNGAIGIVNSTINKFQQKEKPSAHIRPKMTLRGNIIYINQEGLYPFPVSPGYEMVNWVKLRDDFIFSVHSDNDVPFYIQYRYDIHNRKIKITEPDQEILSGLGPVKFGAINKPTTVWMLVTSNLKKINPQIKK